MDVVSCRVWLVWHREQDCVSDLSTNEAFEVFALSNAKS